MEFACSPRLCVGFLLVLWFHHENTHVRSFSSLDRGTGSESGVGPQVPCRGCPLLLRDQFSAVKNFNVHYICDQQSIFAFNICVCVCVCAHTVAEEEDPTEEAEEVGCEQGEVDRGGTAQLHHDGHEAVQSKHTQRVRREQEA